jgi:hypothetical protein
VAREVLGGRERSGSVLGARYGEERARVWFSFRGYNFENLGFAVSLWSGPAALPEIPDVSGTIGSVCFMS